MCPSSVPILSEIDPVPAPTPHFLKIHLNIKLSSTSGSPKWSLPSGFPTMRATCPVHLILLDLITRKIMGEQYRSFSFSLRSFSPLPCYFVPLRPKYSPQSPILKHPQPTFLPQCERPSFTPVHRNRQIIVLYILIFIFWIANWKIKDSAPNDSKHCLTANQRRI